MLIEYRTVNGILGSYNTSNRSASLDSLSIFLEEVIIGWGWSVISIKDKRGKVVEFGGDYARCI